MPQPEFIQERLKSLNTIDDLLLATLLHASQAVGTIEELKRGNENMKPQFENHARSFYNSLEEATVGLRREIKHLDENVGTRLLPINVNKRATGQDNDKIREQFDKLENELKESS
ncbi:LANO_0D07316g1_1 [Lachancea nothofagi CBS 11611]|uniref:Mediator of RNA polymerase II transcription subunit 11 n=1 Tax=Lachancea nothofagi CBS 11611 TaxID=1266666 RepID=A0A1G4JHZ6_9SACH|nr:LANO_0D07316g1_1 [Lachancea nothofagi CBS 11611]